MPMHVYRLTVLVCALSWFLVGLHAPVLHAVTSHGEAPHAAVLALLALFIIVAVGASVQLLRMPRMLARRPDGDGTR